MKSTTQWGILGGMVLFTIAAVFLIAMGTGFAQVTDPDLTNDGIVNILDISLVGSCFGADLTAFPQCFCADTDGNNTIDFTDFNFVLAAFGQTGFPVGPRCVGPTNTAPVADAGPDQTVQVTDTVQLDGSGSTDGDGDVLTFQWTILSQPPGSTTTLDDPTAVMPTFVVDAPGTYDIQLIVNDGAEDSTPDTLTITTSRPTNTAPVADAGPDQTVQVTDTVQLDGSGSTDGDGDVLTFQWTILSQPPGSTTTLDDPTAVMPTFVVDAPGTYDIQLIVNDGAEDSTPDTLTITTINSPPVANAGPDQTVLVTQPVLLDGTSSSDVDNDSLTFLWSFISIPSGSIAILSDPTSPTPDFLVDLPGAYDVQLIVNDGNANSVPDTVLINTQNSKPVADAGPDQTVPPGTTVDLDGSGSSDVDNDPLTFQWSLIALPTGSTAILSDAAAIQPTFVADLSGVYVAQLIVNDSQEDSDPGTVTIITVNTPPVAEAGLDQTVPRNTLVTLDGSGSSDPDTDPLTYNWTMTIQPAGSTATLTNPTSVNPTFTPDIIGDYTIELIVNDGTDNSAPDTVVITAENTQPIADTGNDQSVSKEVTVQLDGSGSSDANSDPLTFQWGFIQQPGGSTASLSDPVIVNPTFVADQEGTFIVQLIVNDGTVDSNPNTVAITVVNDPPVLDPVGNQIVNLGQTLTFILTGSDPNNDPISFSATPLPLPRNMAMNGSTGVVTFTPDATQVGNLNLTLLVSDGMLTDTETITIDVQQNVLPPGETELTGQILDTNALILGDPSSVPPLPVGTELPVENATVSFLGTAATTTSDSQGFFTLSITGAFPDPLVLDIDSSTVIIDPVMHPAGVTYAGFREQIELIDNVTNTIDRPFFMPRIDAASEMTVNGTVVTTVDPNNTTLVTNPNLGVTLTVIANSAKNPDGSNFTEVLSISEVPAGLAPAALPENLKPNLLITIQPVGIVFDPPVALTFPNTDNLAPDTVMELWSLEAGTGTFVVVGEGKVVGSQIITNVNGGGVRASDWHFWAPCGLCKLFGLCPGDGDPPPPPGTPPPPPDEPEPIPKDPGDPDGSPPGGEPEPPGDPGDDDYPRDIKKSGSSFISLRTGGMGEIHEVVSYRSLGRDRAPQFIYNSLSADPRPVMALHPTLSLNAGVPNLVSTRLEVGGVIQVRNPHAIQENLMGALLVGSLNLLVILETMIILGI